MTKHSRLRVQKEQRGWRVFLYIVLVAAVGIVGWQIDQRYGTLGYIKEFLTSLTSVLTNDSIPRGTIYDRNLKQIAVNLDRVSVYARPREIGSIPETVKALGEILSLDEKKLQDQLESGVLRVWLAEDVSQEQEIAIKSKRLSGVHLQKEAKRHYPNGIQAAHLIGYAENGIGLAGVENYYDRLLAGSKLQEQKEQQQLNSPQDLVLTLDFKIQDILDKLVEDIAKDRKVGQVVAYLMEGRTGEIIGGAQLPGFDPNSFTKYAKEVLANSFVTPILVPNKFRLLLRDAAFLHGEDDQEPLLLPWSVRPNGGNLGNQLRLWEWLGLNEKPLADFHVSMQPGEKLVSEQQPVLPQPSFLEMVPEYATPFSLLTAFAMLQNEGRSVRPFVVKKSLDSETGLEFFQSERDGGGRPGGEWRFILYDSVELFRSQARQGKSKTYFFRDEILTTTLKGSNRQMMINELLLVTIPAGGNDLNLLVFVEREPDGPSPKNGTKTIALEQLVEERVERISVLQQVAKTVADVVEPEFTDDGNYQGEKGPSALSSRAKSAKDKGQGGIAIMPDLHGQSLRKSLRLLQGMQVKISIQGTGKVVSQKPPPGTSLKGVSDCTLTLEKGEDTVLEKLSKEVSAKK
jgi:cell division protein FtsI (penicillin-binding protein 3)